MDKVEQRAREMYIAECERSGGEETARMLRNGRTDWSAGCAIRAITAALREQAGAPEGWKLVPVELTRDMLGAAYNNSYATRSIESTWAAMLAASPSPPVEQAARGGVDDTARMDWLEGHDVEVREPLLYGSRSMFHAQRVSDDDEPYRNGLRAQIDSYLTGERHG